MRPVRLIVFVGVLAVVAWFALSRLAVPFAEERTAEAIGATIGAETKVDMEAPMGFGLVKGEVGDVTVTADKLDRQGLTVRRLMVWLRDADVDLAGLTSEGITIEFSRIDMRAIVSEDAVTRYLRDSLKAQGVPGAGKARAELVPGRMIAVLGKTRVPLTVKVVGPTKVELQPAGSKLFATALAKPVDLGPFPYSIRLRGIRIEQDRAVVSGGRPGGHETITP